MSARHDIKEETGLNNAAPLKESSPDLNVELASEFTNEFTQLIRARYPLIYLQSYEECRALTFLSILCKKRQANLYEWSRTEGIYKDAKAVAGLVDPMAALKWFEENNEKAILVLKDYHHYLKDPLIIRKLRDLAQSLKSTQKTIVFISPTAQIPPDLSKDITLTEFPLPNRNEIEKLLRKVINEMGLCKSIDETDLHGLIDASCGLTQEEIENVLAKSLVSSGKLEKLKVFEEKRQIVKKSGILEFIEQKNTNQTIGGLYNLRQWLKVRRSGFTEEARAIKLPPPKGVMLVGVPGCGKSLTALAVSQEWQLPLIRLDLGRVFSGIVGSSENNIREALRTTEAVSPCILWIDEIEKGLSGSQSGSSDGGTSTRVFGTVLTWMQEKKSPVFVIATANDISQLPPEFLRKGRFDEIFFVDLPSTNERTEIFDIQLRRFGWNTETLNIETLSKESEGFSGAEIEQAIVSARFDAFNEGYKEISEAHILSALKQSIPLSKTMGDRIETLRKWATHRARSATLAIENKVQDVETSTFKSRAQSLERNHI